MKKPLRFPAEILELETKGFIHPPNRMLSYLRNFPEYKNIRKFKADRGCHGSQTYSCFDIFGTNIVYFIYKIDKTQQLSNHLTNLFYTHNPNPSQGLRQSFTNILHSNFLTWTGEFSR